MTGIIGALSAEVDSLIAEMTNCKEQAIGRLIVCTGTLCKQRVAVCRSGVGKVAAAYAAAVLITVCGADEIINTGVAGGTAPRGSMVIADRLVQHDVRAFADDLPPGQIEGFDSPYMPADCALAAALRTAADQRGIACVTGTIASGDQFICDRKKLDWLKSEFSISAVDMESAAIAQVCVLAGVPFAAVRTVTDNADEEAIGDYYELVESAALRSAGVLKTYLQNKSL